MMVGLAVGEYESYTDAAAEPANPSVFTVRDQTRMRFTKIFTHCIRASVLPAKACGQPVPM